MTASGRTLSRIARVTARCQAGDYLALLPACGRGSQDGWPDKKPGRVLWAFASQPPVVSEAAAAVPPFAGAAVFAALPSALQGLARCFEPVRILFPVAIGGFAGMTASATGSGGAVCPSTAAGGALVFLCTAAPAAGSGFFCARRLLRLGQSLLVLRLRWLLELVVRLLPLLCLVCLACLACLVCLVCLACLALPGPMQCQVAFLSSGCWRRSASGGFDWRDVAQVAVPLACGLFSSAGKFYRFSSGFEVLDQVFLPPTSGRSFIGGASAWFCLLLG